MHDENVSDMAARAVNLFSRFSDVNNRVGHAIRRLDPLISKIGTYTDEVPTPRPAPSRPPLPAVVAEDPHFAALARRLEKAHEATEALRHGPTPASPRYDA